MHAAWGPACPRWVFWQTSSNASIPWKTVRQIRYAHRFPFKSIAIFGKPVSPASCQPVPTPQTTVCVWWGGGLRLASARLPSNQKLLQAARSSNMLHGLLHILGVCFSGVCNGQNLLRPMCVCFFWCLQRKSAEAYVDWTDSRKQAPNSESHRLSLQPSSH